MLFKKKKKKKKNIWKANMYFGANSRCRIENSVEKEAIFIQPLYISGLKIVPRIQN